MKLNQLMIAAIAMCGASQVMAAGIVRLTGASASSINVARAAKQLCDNAGGTYTLYKTTASTSSLGNVFTGRCSVEFDGITENEVRVNVSGGSANAVLDANGGGNGTAGFLVPSGACAALGAGTGSLSWVPAGRMFNCGTTLAENARSDGGYLDVEGTWFTTAIPSVSLRDPGNYVPAGFSQVFGVAVNTTLYNAMQNFQKTAAGGNLVPASCTNADFTPACQPSVNKATITALINSNTSPSGPKGQASALLTGSGTTAVTYCMRPQTSGTQQSAQLYFLNYEGTDANFGGKVNVVNEGTNVSVAGNIRYTAQVNSGSSDVRACLNNTTGYRFGMLSGENNPVGGTDTYRFIRLNEVAMTEGTATATNTATAIPGRYDFVYETVAFCPEGTCAPIIDAMNGVLPAGASTPGLFLTGVESRFGRGGNSATPFSFR